jgi:energy-coupling factor transporter ATP-binding protein EcfA2
MDHPAAETLSMRCPQCGSLLPARASFCGHCGAQLRPAVAQTPAPADVSSSPAPVPPANPPAASSVVTVFISYSRQDGAFVARLQADLQAGGIHIWIDHQGIKPGTPDWEEALRRAIRKAGAIVLVASPESRQSRYVKDELRVAAMYQRPVYPIWAAGSEWMEAIPLGLGGTQYIDARGAAYQAGVAELITALEEGALHPPTLSGVLPAPGGQVEPSFEPRNPYKGLRAFTAADAQDYFGRERLVSELVERLTGILSAAPAERQTGRLLAIIGPSGSGKSSVLLAGLLPRLQAGERPGSAGWVYLEPLTPGAHPLESLTLALAPHLPERSLKAIREDLKDDSGRGLHLLARALVRQPEAKVVLLIDQFEELFTLTADEEERQRFVDLLLTAATEPRGPLLVLLTMRADFYDRPMQYPALARLIEAQQCAVLPMDLDDLRAVIERPAALPDVQMTFEGTLVGDLLFEIQGQVGALPLLQFTLDQLFQRRAGHQLTLAAYREIGGVRGALARQAEATYAALPSDEHRLLVRSLFLRLISPGATEQDTTRRRAALAELSLPDPKQTTRMREVADAFVAARLLVTSEVAGTTTIEVSHEALIREWARLGGWLREAREDIHLQQQMSADAAGWLQRGKPADRLYRGSALAEAQAWAERNTPSTDEVAFLQASAAAQEQQQAAEKATQARELDLQRRVVRRQRSIIGLTGIIAIILVVGLVVGLLLQGQVLAELPPSVTSLADSGPGSLRQTILEAHPGAAITFARNLKGTILLTHGELSITKSLEISGPGASVLAISGGGQQRVFNISQGAAVTISNLTITDGAATCPNPNQIPQPPQCQGGGIFNAGSLTLINSTVSHNTGIGFGGGIYNTATMTISDSTISENTAASGGGIDNSGTLFLANSTISGNKALNGAGISNAFDLSINNSAISDNQAQKVGGGISNLSIFELINSTVSGNRAPAGAGIFSRAILPGNGIPYILFCTIYNNTADDQGGGIVNDPGDRLDIQNSILAGNHATSYPNVMGSLNTDGYNLSTAEVIFNDPFTRHHTDITLNDLSDLHIDPVLHNNNSPDGKPALTPTHALLSGSQAIDVIPLTASDGSHPCTVNDLVSSTPITTDQRGMPRPDEHEQFCDIGAYESSG